MASERISVKGMGAITPLGIGVAAYWDNLIRGKSGIGRMTRFDKAGLSVKMAAEVRDFEPTDFLPKKIDRTPDLFMQFAL